MVTVTDGREASRYTTITKLKHSDQYINYKDMQKGHKKNKHVVNIEAAQWEDLVRNRSAWKARVYS